MNEKVKLEAAVNSSVVQAADNEKHPLVLEGTKVTGWIDEVAAGNVDIKFRIAKLAINSTVRSMIDHIA